MKAGKAFGATAAVSSSRFALAAGRATLGTVLGAAAALALFASVARAADTRTLDLYNMHTKERLTITFKKDGRYVPSALSELNRFLRDWRRNEATRMDPRLFDTVWELYQKSGSRQPIQVVCGYRSLATNNLLRSRSSAVAKHSQHTLGRAMDMNIPDVSVDKLRMIGVQMQNGGVGWYPSANSPFVHIDVGSVRAWPRLSRTQLVGLFPDGKTAHIPSDGKPLPGYQQALAELQREKGDSSIAVASAAPSSSGSGKGLLAMLFSSDEEDSSEEIGSAGGDDDAPAVAAKPAPAAPKLTPPAAAVATAPAAPVLTAAFTARPPAAAPVAAPERRVTSLADATLPGNLEPAAVPQLTGADRLAMDNVPLPKAKPSEIAVDTVEVAMVDAAPIMLPPTKPPAPVEVPLPVAANRQEDAIAAQLALAEVAQDQVPPAAAALSFAPPIAEPPLPAGASARQPVQTAALTPPARKSAPTPSAELARPVIDGGKSDMFGNIELPEIASEDGPLLLDGGQSVYWGRFRTLSHPDQVHLAQLFEAPSQVMNATFSAKPYGALVSTRFAGPVAAPNQVIDFTHRQLAMR